MSNLEKLYALQDAVWEKVETFAHAKPANEDCAELHRKLVEYYSNIYDDLEDLVEIELGLKVSH